MIKHFEAELLERKELAPQIFEFKFKIIGTDLEFKAGQYVVLKVEDKRRIYSIASPQWESQGFTLIVEYIDGGVGTEYFKKLEVGGTASFMAPAGVFLLQNLGTPKVFLATGTGIAPILSQLDTLLKDQNDVRIILFWGLKTAKDSYYLEEILSKVKENPRFSFYLCLSREVNPEVFEKAYVKKGRISEVLLRYFEAQEKELPKEYEYLVCGGRDMVSSVVELLHNKGIVKEQIHFEKY